MEMDTEDTKTSDEQYTQAKKTSWEDIIKILVEKNPDPLSMIINALRGHPEQIKANTGSQ
jgi:hypothetical protein